jgi:hypothetical protein
MDSEGNCTIHCLFSVLRDIPQCKNTINNSLALVRERTMPTERLPLVGEVSANFRG